MFDSLGVLHEAVLMVLDQNAEIESLDHVSRYKHNQYYVLRDSKARRNLFQVAVNTKEEIVFTELTTNNVHIQYSVFDIFVCKRFLLYSAEEQLQIQQLANKILMFCKERMNNEELFLKRRIHDSFDD